MKRFWTSVTVVEDPDGWAIRLDNAPVRTPARRGITVPVRAMADAIAAEWDAQDGDVRPLAMPFTRTAATCLDRVAPERKAVAEIVSGYAGTDLLCYRAERPAALAARQAASWDPLLDWAADAMGARLLATDGVMPREQDGAALNALTARVAVLDPWRLTALSELVTISGSLVLGLAVLAGRVSSADAWIAARIDEQWNIDEWGEDADAADHAARRERDFLHAAHVMSLLDACD